MTELEDSALGSKGRGFEAIQHPCSFPPAAATFLSAEK